MGKIGMSLEDFGRLSDMNDDGFTMEHADPLRGDAPQTGGTQVAGPGLMVSNNGMVPNANPLSIEPVKQDFVPAAGNRNWGPGGREYNADYYGGVGLSAVPMSDLEGNPRHVGNKTKAYGIATTKGSGLNGVGGEEYRTGDEYDMVITKTRHQPGTGKVASNAEFATNLDRNKAIRHGFREKADENKPFTKDLPGSTTRVATGEGLELGGHMLKKGLTHRGKGLSRGKK